MVHSRVVRWITKAINLIKYGKSNMSSVDFLMARWMIILIGKYMGVSRINDLIHWHFPNKPVIILLVVPPKVHDGKPYWERPIPTKTISRPFKQTHLHLQYTPSPTLPSFLLIPWRRYFICYHIGHILSWNEKVDVTYGPVLDILQHNKTFCTTHATSSLFHCPP